MDIGYIRVSTQEQSTARQLDNVKLDMPAFEDKISGIIKDRPKLNECLLVLRKGDTLHVHSMCRLARNLRHLQEIVDSLMQKGVNIHFHKEGLIFKGDSTNAFSMLMLQLLGAVSEFERTNMKERQAEGIAISKIRGTRSGKPFGNQPLNIDKLRPIAIEHSKSGMNISQIARAMNLSRPSITKLLS
jgi:DNA invertase Pin-like site-specific DNA recombinase